MLLRIHMKEPCTEALGPGKRFALWVQGCPRNCPGCVAPDSHDPDGGQAADSGALALEILISGAEGVTVSGGEPFLQPEALADMISRVRAEKDLGVIVYTGYTLEELHARKDPATERLLALTDLLIDGPYLRELDDGKSLRGSKNQRVIPLTGRYRDSLSLYGAEGRELEVIPHGAEVHIVGIPSAQAQAQLQNWLGGSPAENHKKDGE